MSASGVAYVPSMPASIVAHCGVGELCGPLAAAHLVLARGTALEAYTLHEEPAAAVAPSGGGRGGGAAAGARRAALDGIGGAKLELVARASLNGVVESLRVVRPIGTARDRILVAFADAKLSTLELDAASRSFVTIAVHSFESLAAETGCGELRVAPLLRADAGGSCAAMLAYGAHLVILPQLAPTGGGATLRAGGAGALVVAGAGALSLAAPAIEPLSCQGGAPLLACRDAVAAAAAAIESGSSAPSALSAAAPSSAASAAAAAAALKRIDLAALGLTHVRRV